MILSSDLDLPIPCRNLLTGYFQPCHWRVELGGRDLLTGPWIPPPSLKEIGMTSGSDECEFICGQLIDQEPVRRYVTFPAILVASAK